MEGGLTDRQMHATRAPLSTGRSPSCSSPTSPVRHRLRSQVRHRRGRRRAMRDPRCVEEYHLAHLLVSRLAQRGPAIRHTRWRSATTDSFSSRSPFLRAGERPPGSQAGAGAARNPLQYIDAAVTAAFCAEADILCQRQPRILPHRQVLPGAPVDWLYGLGCLGGRPIGGRLRSPLFSLSKT